MASFTEIGLIASIKGLTTFNGGVAQMRRQMGLTGSSARTFSGTFNQSMGGVGQSILNTGRTVRSFGNELTFLGFQLTFLATGAFAAITQAGVEFESTITRMSTLANVATEDLGGLADVALTLGPSLGQGPTELADAMFDIVSSGFSAAQAMEIIESTAKGAALGLGDVRTVTDAVTSAMKAYAADGLTASRATDILVQAIREGKGEVDALAGTIGRVVGIAAQLGISFEETTAFIATFTRVGVPAEVAVTSLRSALTNILKPTDAAREALAEYGLTMDFIKQIIEERGLMQALTFLAETFKDDEEGLARIIGSARALAGVLINTGPLIQDYEQILANISQEANQTSEAFDLFAQTTEFKLGRAKAAFESLFITISAAFKPVLNLILDQVPKLTTALSDFAKENTGLFLVAGGLAAIVAVAGPLLIVIGLAITSIGTFISVIGALVSALAFLINPFSVVIAALAAFAATFVGLFVASFSKTREKLAEQGRAISFDAFAWGRNIMIQFARGLASVVAYIFQVLAAVGRAIASLLRPGSPPKLLPDLDKWGAKAMEAYLEGWGQADFNIFQEIASRLESFLRGIGLPEIDVVPAIIEIRTEIAKLLDTFRSGGRVSLDAIEAIAANFGSAAGVVRQYIAAMLQLEAANKAVERAQQALNAVHEKYNRLLQPISDELDAISDRRQQVVDDMRIAELQSILSDANAPALARELAQMELREIELRRQQSAIEDTRDADVERAEEALTAAEIEAQAAEDRVQALQQFIQVQEQNNALIKEQIELLKRLAEEIGGIGGGGIGDIPEPEELPELEGGGLVGGELDIDDFLPPDLSDRIDMFVRKLGAEELGIEMFGDLGELDIFGGITDAAEGLVAEFAGIGEEIAAAWQPVIDAGEDLTDVWSDVFSTDLRGTPLGEFLGSFDPFQILENVAGPLLEFGEIVSAVFGSLGGGEGEGAGILQTVAGWFNDLGIGINDVITFLINLNPAVLAIRTPFIIFGGVMDWIQGQVQGFINILAAVIPVAQLIWQVIVTVTTGIVTAVSEWVSSTSIKISLWSQDTRDKIETWAADTWESIVTWAENAATTIETWVKDVILSFVQFVLDGIDQFNKLKDLVFGQDGIISNAIEAGKTLFEQFVTAVVGEDGSGGIIGLLKSSIETTFENILASILAQVGAWFSAGVDLAQGLIDGIMSLLGPFIEEIQAAIDAILGGAEETAESESPSKRTMRLGHDIMEGLKIGMEGQYVNVFDSLIGFVDSFIGASSALADFAANPEAAAVNAPVSAPPVMSTSNTRTSEFGPIHVYNGMDMAVLIALIRQELNAAL